MFQWMCQAAFASSPSLVGLSDPPEAEIEALRSAVAEVRGAAFDPVPVVVMSPKDAAAYLEGELRLWMSPVAWRNAGRMMEVVDLLPAAEELLPSLVRVLEFGTYGFFDPTAKMFVLVERDDEELGWRQVASHEIVHVFQADAFDLSLSLAPGLENSDVSNAFECLMEGEATYVEHIVRHGDAIHDTDLSTVVVGLWPQMPASPTPPGIPLALVEQMSFHYTVGAQFVQVIRRSGGWSAVDDLYRRPPLSTEQVLHPERLAGKLRDRPMAVTVPVEGVLPGFSPIGTDSMGELGIATMFRAWEHGEAAWGLARGWDGDRMVVLEDDRENWVLVWRSVWDTEADARAFADAITSRWGREAGFGADVRGTGVVVVRRAPADGSRALFEAAWRGKTREAKRVHHLINTAALRGWEETRKNRSTQVHVLAAPHDQRLQAPSEGPHSVP